MIDFSKYYTMEEIVDLTSDLVRIPSHSEVPGRETEVGDFIYEWALARGFDVRKVQVEGGRNNVYINVNGTGGGKDLLFNGHIDTVPPFDMIIEPFDPVVRDGMLYGRGTNDMKGGVACMLMALLVLRRAGIDLKGNIMFTAVCGEEEESDGTEIFALNEKRHFDGAIVGEPSGYMYSLGNRGLEWIEIRFKGKTMHGGQAHLGVNAISKASKFIERVAQELEPKIKSRVDEYIGPGVMNYGKIFGGDMPSTVAGECTLQLDRRYLPGETPESVILSSFLCFFQIKLSSSCDNLFLMMQIICEHLNTEEAPLNRCRGWTDAGILSTYMHIPTAIFGPGQLENSHTKDEHIALEMLYNFVSFYANIAADFCNQAGD